MNPKWILTLIRKYEDEYLIRYYYIDQYGHSHIKTQVKPFI